MDNAYQIKTIINQSTQFYRIGYWKPLFIDENLIIESDIQKIIMNENNFNDLINKASKLAGSNDFFLTLIYEIYLLLIKPAKNLTNLLCMKVFMRHSNRLPIQNWKRISNEPRNENAGLLYPNAINSINIMMKGWDEIDEYRSIFSKMTFYSSPISRCIETIQILSSSNNIIIDPIYQFLIDEKFYYEFDKIHPLSDQITEIIKKLELLIDCKLSYQMQLYSIYSTRICYLDMGIYDPVLSNIIWNEIKEILPALYNDFYVFYLSKVDLKPYLIDFNDSSIIVTHDNLVFSLAKFLAKEKVLKLPKYLSNVRIEKWTDGIRIFYDNLLIRN